MVGSAGLGDDHGMAPHLHSAAPRAQAGPPPRCAAVALLNASHSNCVLLTAGHSVRRCTFKTLYVEAMLEWRRKVPAPSTQCLRRRAAVAHAFCAYPGPALVHAWRAHRGRLIHGCQKTCTAGYGAAGMMGTPSCGPELVPDGAVPEVALVLRAASWYEVLELSSSASLDDIKRAHKLKSLGTHPDKLGGADSGAHEASVRVNMVSEPACQCILSPSFSWNCVR